MSRFLSVEFSQKSIYIVSLMCTTTIETRSLWFWFTISDSKSTLCRTLRNNRSRFFEGSVTLCWWKETNAFKDDWWRGKVHVCFWNSKEMTLGFSAINARYERTKDECRRFAALQKHCWWLISQHNHTTNRLLKSLIDSSFEIVIHSFWIS